MKHLKLLVIGLFALSFVSCAKQPAISDGSIVKVQYKGTLADGTVFDTTEDKEPLTFLVGANQVIPEFEKQITALRPGQSASFKVKAKEAYGEPDPEKIDFGMKVKLTYQDALGRKDKEGNSYLSYFFEPA